MMVTQTIQPIEKTIREIEGITYCECFFCKGWFDNPKTTKVTKKDGVVIGYHCCHAISCQNKMENFVRGD
jgi:hypothetical protein